MYFWNCQVSEQSDEEVLVRALMVGYVTKRAQILNQWSVESQVGAPPTEVSLHWIGREYKNGL